MSGTHDAIYGDIIRLENELKRLTARVAELETAERERNMAQRLADLGAQRRESVIADASLQREAIEAMGYKVIG